MPSRVRPAYTGLAPYYDLFQAGAVDYQGWFHWLRDLLAENGEPWRNDLRVLDLGCGTGTFARLFAQAGASVVGVDRSAPMLAVAETSCRGLGERVRLIHQDLRRLKVPGHFDLAVSFCDTLNYLTSLTALELALARVRRHLKPEGLAAFDLKAPAYYRRSAGTVYGRVESKAAYLCEVHYTPGTRLCLMRLTLFLREADGSYRREEELHRQRAHTSAEVKAALGRAGLHLVRSYRHPVAPSRLIFLARA